MDRTASALRFGRHIGELRVAPVWLQQDISVLINNTFQVTTSAMILALKLMHMAKQTKNSEIA